MAKAKKQATAAPEVQQEQVKLPLVAPAYVQNDGYWTMVDAHRVARMHGLVEYQAVRWSLADAEAGDKVHTLDNTGNTTVIEVE